MTRTQTTQPTQTPPISTHQDGGAAVEVTDLRRRYGGASGYEAVRGVSFSVAPGQLFALLGTNGAGKTSTLEVVEGLSAPTAGHVRILGRDPIKDRRSVRPRIGIMLQRGGFPGDLTVVETARMWSGTLSHPRPVDEALELVDLAHRRTVRVSSLSGGEQRRLDLALALMNRPEVLFLDEPTTGLDPESRRNTWSLIEGLTQDGAAVVLTTHYLEEAEALANQLAIMHRGEIVVSGTPSDIAAAYPSTISFRLPAGVRLPQLPETELVSRDPKTVLHTATLQRSLGELLAWAAADGVELADLQARSASLEEAFLAVADNAESAESATGTSTDPSRVAA